MIPSLFELSPRAGVIASGDGSDFWFPAKASSFAADVDALYYFIYWVSVVFFVAIVACMTWFVIRYRRTATRTQPERSSSHNTTLELTWSILPAGLLVVFFYWGWKSFLDMMTPYRDAMEIQVGAYKWGWNFTYPSGHTDSELHMPVGRDINLRLNSADVLHSFWVPELRTKLDVIPGRYNLLPVHAILTGEFQLKCTEYCGTGHSGMRAKVVIHESGGFEKWIEAAEAALLTMPPRDLGELLYTKRGCVTCHTLDGSPKVGPSFKETSSLWNKQRKLADGSEVEVEANYIRESILDPPKKVVAGFHPQMPVMPGIKEKEIDGLIAYIKSLSASNQ